MLFFIGPNYIISGTSSASAPLFDAAWSRIQSAFRPSTVKAHQTHFFTYLAYLIFMDLPISLSVHNILSFLEYLYQNALSPKVIKNYLSSISSVSKNFNLDVSALSHISVAHYLRSISINSSFRSTPRGIFDITTLYHISRACDTLSDPALYRALFLTAFFGFLRMSNLAPHSSAKFDHTRHLLRQDLFFHPPGRITLHIILFSFQNSTTSFFAPPEP